MNNRIEGERKPGKKVASKVVIKYQDPETGSFVINVDLLQERIGDLLELDPNYISEYIASIPAEELPLNAHRNGKAKAPEGKGRKKRNEKK